MPRSSAHRKTASSIAPGEVAQFSRHADDWWNPEGAFKPLHRLNPVRLGYIRDQACAHFFGHKAKKENGMPASAGMTSSAEKKLSEKTVTPAQAGVPFGFDRKALKGLTVLDVGCGGGLLAEPLARMGAIVTGLDASKESIAAAKKHARETGLTIDYRTGSAEELAHGKTRYDLITALEVAEHVADLDSFVAALVKLLKPGGLLIMSTLNRTPKSFLLGIVAAEYILNWVPRGTHQWKKFLRPSELVRQLEESGLSAADLTGLVFNPLRGEFELSAKDLDVNYLLTAVKSQARG